MTLLSCGVRMRPLNTTTTLIERDVHYVVCDFSSPGAFCDDQSPAQTKRGMYTVSTSQQTESINQRHLAGISL